MYRLSHHAYRRIKQRSLPIDGLLAAMEGIRYVLPDGTIVLCDSISHCALILDPNEQVVLSAFRLRRKNRKRYARFRKEVE